MSRDIPADGKRDADLPSGRQALRRAFRLAYEAEPRLLVLSFVLTAGSFVPDALGALWLKIAAQGITEHRAGLVRLAAFGLAASVAVGWIMRTVGGRVELLFQERATVALETHVARLQVDVSTIEHFERPEYLDRLQLLRDQVFLLNHLYPSFTATVASLGRLVLTLGLLASVHPALIALALFAVPTVVVAAWRAGVERRAEERNASGFRRSRHFFELATTAGPAKELRTSGVSDQVADWRREAWAARHAAIARARWISALWHAGAWALFGAAYAGAIAFVASGLNAPAGDVLLVLAAGAGLSRYLDATVSQADFLRWCIDAAKRLAWLEQYAARHREGAGAEPPAHLHDGMRLDHVSFRYPGTDRLVLDDVDLALPAGSVVAVVGENGAGKSTLVKLLCRLYDPTDGTILVDGVDLRQILPAAWRARLSGAFQDFFRFEFAARRTVGLGDLPRVDDDPALHTAVDRAGAGDVVDRMPRGLDTQLGPTWDEGIELSFGQWQKLALARGLMRDDVLLCVLDEPTAALDAETEHQLFERFATAARAGTSAGRITVLVSHRFSTVRMADLIVVLDGAHVREVGSHDELIARNGLYAELYGIQAAAYR